VIPVFKASTSIFPCFPSLPFLGEHHTLHPKSEAQLLQLACSPKVKLMLIHHMPQHPLQTITRNCAEQNKHGQVFNPSDSICHVQQASKLAAGDSECKQTCKGVYLAYFYLGLGESSCKEIFAR